MRLLVKLRRSLQKKYFPTERDKVMRRWKADQGDQVLRLNYRLSPDSVVMDLGGYRGDWAHEIHSRYRCRVLVFEPVLSFADGIAQRFAGNSAVEVHPYGLGKSSRTELIGLSADASSLFQQDGQLESIQLQDVAEWFQQHRIDRVALMKINIEGGEYELVERLLDTGLVSRVDNIQVQFHDVAADSRSRMEHILRRIQQSHSPTYQYPFVWENWQHKVA